MLDNVLRHKIATFLGICDDSFKAHRVGITSKRWAEADMWDFFFTLFTVSSACGPSWDQCDNDTVSRKLESAWAAFRCIKMVPYSVKRGFYAPVLPGTHSDAPISRLQAIKNTLNIF